MIVASILRNEAPSSLTNRVFSPVDPRGAHQYGPGEEERRRSTNREHEHESRAWQPPIVQSRASCPEAARNW